MTHNGASAKPKRHTRTTAQLKQSKLKVQLVFLIKNKMVHCFGFDIGHENIRETRRPGSAGSLDSFPLLLMLTHRRQKGESKLKSKIIFLLSTPFSSLDHDRYLFMTIIIARVMDVRSAF